MLKTDIYKMSKEKIVKFGRRSGYIFNIQNFKLLWYHIYPEKYFYFVAKISYSMVFSMGISPF